MPAGRGCGTVARAGSSGIAVSGERDGRHRAPPRQVVGRASAGTSARSCAPRPERRSTASRDVSTAGPDPAPEAISPSPISGRPNAHESASRPRVDAWNGTPRARPARYSGSSAIAAPADTPAASRRNSGCDRPAATRRNPAASTAPAPGCPGGEHQDRERGHERRQEREGRQVSGNDEAEEDARPGRRRATTASRCRGCRTDPTANVAAASDSATARTGPSAAVAAAAGRRVIPAIDASEPDDRRTGPGLERTQSRRARVPRPPHVDGRVRPDRHPQAERRIEQDEEPEDEHRRPGPRTRCSEGRPCAACRRRGPLRRRRSRRASRGVPLRCPRRRNAPPRAVGGVAPAGDPDRSAIAARSPPSRRRARVVATIAVPNSTMSATPDPSAPQPIDGSSYVRRITCDPAGTATPWSTKSAASSGTGEPSSVACQPGPNGFRISTTPGAVASTEHGSRARPLVAVHGRSGVRSAGRAGPGRDAEARITFEHDLGRRVEAGRRHGPAGVVGRADHAPGTEERGACRRGRPLVQPPRALGRDQRRARIAGTDRRGRDLPAHVHEVERVRGHRRDEERRVVRDPPAVHRADELPVADQLGRVVPTGVLQPEQDRPLVADRGPRGRRQEAPPPRLRLALRAQRDEPTVPARRDRPGERTLARVVSRVDHRHEVRAPR